MSMKRATSPPASAPEDSAPDLRVRRQAARSLVSSALVSGLAITLYFALPLSSAVTTTTLFFLLLGLSGIVALVAWHLWSIVRSPYPRVRGVAALATTVPLFLVVFATTYFVMSRTDAASFSEPLSRLDSAYFTMTVFATVGFGDITPVASDARAVTMVQMVGDVLIVGLVANVIVGAVREGVQRRADQVDRNPGARRDDREDAR